MTSDGWIIDPPVGPFDALEDLRDWREQLRQMPASEARDQALADVEKWIEAREEDAS